MAPHRHPKRYGNGAEYDRASGIVKQIAPADCAGADRACEFRGGFLVFESFGRHTAAEVAKAEKVLEPLGQEAASVSLGLGGPAVEFEVPSETSGTDAGHLCQTRCQRPGTRWEASGPTPMRSLAS